MSDGDETLPKIFRLLDVMSLQIGSMAQDIGIVKSDVGTLESDVGTLKSDVGALKSDMVAVKINVTAHRSETRSGFDRVDRRLDELTHEFRTYRP